MPQTQQKGTHVTITYLHFVRINVTIFAWEIFCFCSIPRSHIMIEKDDYKEIEVLQKPDSTWKTQEDICQISGKNQSVTSRHIKKILDEGLDEKSNMHCMHIANSDKPVTKEYKENSKLYFKRLGLDFCDHFNITSYKDLHPDDFANAIDFIIMWEYN